MVHDTQQQRPAPLNRPLQTPAAAGSKKIVIAVVAAVMVLGMGMVGFLFTKTIASDHMPSIDAVIADRQPVIKNTMAFAGTRGGVIWIITEKQTSGDSLYYELMVVDPKTNVLNGKGIIVPSFKSNSALDLSKKMGSSFWQYGDLAYNLSDDNGLVAYNIYNGKQVLNPDMLSGKFPELKPGILKTEHSASEKIFKITTTAGDIVNFNPLSQTIIGPGKPKGKREEAVTKELYLSDGLKHRLYLFTKKGDGFPIVFSSYLQESQLPGPDAPKTNNVKDIFGNIHIEQVSEKNYFRAQPLIKDQQGNLLVLYKTDLTEQASVMLESVNQEGKTNWSLQDTVFLKIGKAFASENLGCEYASSDDILVISLNAGKKQYIAIDINTGKILWRFDPEVYLAKQTS